MKKQIKKLMVLGLVIGLSVSSAMTAFAGQWKNEYEGGSWWWYQNDDGSYPVNVWQTIDGKSYHFDIRGYLETDTLTLDGYMVDANGVWIESIPRKSEAECEKYWHEEGIKMLIEDYEAGYSTEAEVTEMAILLMGEEEGRRVMEEIRKTHTYASKDLDHSGAKWQEENAKNELIKQALRDARGAEAQKKAVYAYLESQEYETSLLKIINREYKYNIECSSSPKAYVYGATDKYIMTQDECTALLNYLKAEEPDQIESTANAFIEIIELVW